MSGKPGAVSFIFSEKDQTGDVLIAASTIIGPRYDVWRTHDLHVQGAYNNIRSMRVYPSLNGASTLLMFRPGPSFTGGFMQLTNNHGSAVMNEDLPVDWYVDTGSYSLPTTGSLLAIETQRRDERRVSFRQNVTPFYNQLLQNLPSEVSPVGDLRTGWMAFPQGAPDLSPDRIYLYLSQKIEINFSDFWANYDGHISYYLRLSVNEGRVTARVARAHWKVEAGAFAHIIGLIVDPNVKLGIISLETAINDQLAALPPNVSSLYYLPGTQLTPVGNGDRDIRFGGADADVTIVVELK